MSQGQTILLVEDNPAVLRFMHEVLTRAGYAVHCAGSAPEALQRAARLQARLDLAVMDVVLAETSGLALARDLAERYPGLRVLLVSGYAVDPETVGMAGLERVELLAKPFTVTELVERVRAALAAGWSRGPAEWTEAAVGAEPSFASVPEVREIRLPDEFYHRRRTAGGAVQRRMPWSGSSSYVTDGVHYGIRLADGAVHWLSTLWAEECRDERGGVDGRELLDRLRSFVEAHLAMEGLRESHAG